MIGTVRLRRFMLYTANVHYLEDMYIVCIYVPNLHRYIINIRKLHNITYIGLISIHITVIHCLCFFLQKHGSQNISENILRPKVDPNLHALAEGEFVFEMGVAKWFVF